MAEFQKTYNRLPTLYAAFAYDVVMNLDAAVKAMGGNLQDKAVFLENECRQSSKEQKHSDLC